MPPSITRIVLSASSDRDGHAPEPADTPHRVPRAYDSSRHHSTVGDLFASRNDPTWGTDPSHFAPEAIESLMETLSRFYGPTRRSYFRVSSAGWDNVPDDASLVVANHSGGTVFPDAWGLGWAWYNEFGFRHSVHPMGHDMIFTLKETAEPLARLGILRADRELAHKILKFDRKHIIVMPGGDLETWRPFKDRYKVRWSGRTGYARTALRAGVPITPVACAGAHSTFVVLSDGRRFARAIGLHKLARAEIFPVHLSFPYGIAFGPLPHLPPPAHFRYLVGEPIAPVEDVPEGEQPSALAVREMDLRVRAAMQGLLDRLAAGELL